LVTRGKGCYDSSASQRANPKIMTLVPNIVAVFEQPSTPLLRCEVFKSDGDLGDANRPDNRYVRVASEFKLIAAVWDKKFLRFE
jgi:hypothetical protein